MTHRQGLSLVLVFLLLSIPSVSFAKINLTETQKRGGEVEFAFQHDRVLFNSAKYLQQDSGTTGSGGSTYFQGLMDGKMAAQTGYSAGGWFLGGVGMGLLLGLIGTLIIGVASTGGVEPPASRMMMIQDESKDYQVGFLEGYSKKAKGKKFGSALGGGLLGTLVWVLILVSAQN